MKILFNLLFLFIYLISLLFAISFITNKKKLLNKNILNLNNSNLDLLLNLLTNNDKGLYKFVKKCLESNPDEELCIYQFLCPKDVVGKTKVLIGPKTDGSYVMLNNFENIKLAYSIGISNSIEFDKVLAEKGIDVYMYDHTINRLPFKSGKFHWKKIGIGGNSQRSKNIQTLQDMLKENGHLHEKNMILKMDVEGAEWNTLNDVGEEVLSQFKYIILEYHFYNIPINLLYKVLKKIYKTHQIFYTHCNPFSPIINFGNNRICGCIEVSYIIRKGYNFIRDQSIYPIKELSCGNNKGFNENILRLFDNYKQS